MNDKILAISLHTIEVIVERTVLSFRIIVFSVIYIDVFLKIRDFFQTGGTEQT